jgi:hypothetical protein
VRLTPGKHDTGGRLTTCYASFKESAALVLHELSVVDPWVDKVNKRSLHKIFFVLDEFGAYSCMLPTQQLPSSATVSILPTLSFATTAVSTVSCRYPVPVVSTQSKRNMFGLFQYWVIYLVEIYLVEIYLVENIG